VNTVSGATVLANTVDYYTAAFITTVKAY
jgi:hypothetical protein